MGFKVFNNKEIQVLLGDITKVEGFEAVVNPANSYLIMGGGVAGALKRAGGEEIEAEARRYAPTPVGKAVITNAGKLKVKYVIHSPTMKSPASRIGIDNVRKATRAALKVAEEAGIKSVIFPGMGTGVGGVPASLAADAMVEEIMGFLKDSKSVVRVGLIAIDKVLYDAFLKAVKRLVQE